MVTQKKSLVEQLKKVEQRLQEIQLNLRDIKKRARETSTAIHLKQDTKKLEDIRKQLGLS